MAFKLNHVVPWGRTFEEYSRMFRLTEEDLGKRIAGFGDGPASFNCEGHRMGMDITSFDMIYRFTKEELAQRIEEVRATVIQQMRENKENYIWTQIHSVEELEEIRMGAMRVFLEDYERGKEENRYCYHELPNRLNVDDNSYDIGLSSHFLLMYTGLGYEFHIAAITEMLRVCKEVRIFPIVDLDGKYDEMIGRVISYFGRNFQCEIKRTEYEFQKNADKMLVIRKVSE